MNRRLFVHGFLGSPTDWLDTVSKRPDDYFIDLNQIANKITNPENAFEESKSIFKNIIKQNDDIYAYSLGARLILYYFTKQKIKHSGKICLYSVNPGITEAKEREKRIKQDQIWIDKVLTLDQNSFLQEWSEQSVFKADQKKSYPYNKDTAAKMLSCWSLGKQENLWPYLKDLTYNLHFVAGSEDSKFKNILYKIKDSTKLKTYLLANYGHRFPFTYEGIVDKWHWEHYES